MLTASSQLLIKRLFPKPATGQHFCTTNGSALCICRIQAIDLDQRDLSWSSDHWCYDQSTILTRMRGVMSKQLLTSLRIHCTVDQLLANFRQNDSESRLSARHKMLKQGSLRETPHHDDFGNRLTTATKDAWLEPWWVAISEQNRVSLHAALRLQGFMKTSQYRRQSAIADTA